MKRRRRGDNDINEEEVINVLNDDGSKKNISRFVSDQFCSFANDPNKCKTIISKHKQVFDSILSSKDVEGSNLSSKDVNSRYISVLHSNRKNVDAFLLVLTTEYFDGEKEHKNPFFELYCHKLDDKIEVILRNDAAESYNVINIYRDGEYERKHYELSSKRVINVGFGLLNFVLSQIMHDQTRYFGRCYHTQTEGKGLMIGDQRLWIENRKLPQKYPQKENTCFGVTPILHIPVYNKTMKQKFGKKLLCRYEIISCLSRAEISTKNIDSDSDDSDDNDLYRYDATKSAEGYYSQTKKGDLYYHTAANYCTPSFSRFDALTCEKVCAATAIETLLLIRHIRNRQFSVLAWLPRDVLLVILRFIHIDRTDPAWTTSFFSSVQDK